jgi:hypothetical protein
MTRRGSVAVLVLIALLCGAAPARAQVAPRCADGGALLPGDDGIGGTGARPGGDGIGGMGAWPGGDDSGIGGTGVSPQSSIGVVGTITGFASMCVDGIEIHYDADTPVRIDGRPASVGDLAVGQVVEVVAEGHLPELRARDVTVRHVVVGPVSGGEADGAILRVVGQGVALVPETQLPDAASASGEDPLALGTVVRVSGMRRQDGVVVASRITRGQADEEVQIIGPVEASDAGGLSIAGTPLEIVGDVRLAVGEEMRVAGRWTGAALRVDGAEAMPRVPFDGRVAWMDVEGFPRWSANGELRVGGVAIGRDIAPPAFEGLRSSDARVRIGAWLEGGGVVVEGIQPAPALPVRPPLIEGHGPGALLRKLGGFVFRSRAAGRSASGRITVHSGGVRPAPPPGAIPDLPIRPTAPDRAERVERIERPPVPGVAGPLRPPERPPRLQRPPRPPIRPGR